MKKLFLPVFLLGIFFTSCSKDDDVVEETQEKKEEEKVEVNLEVEEFIYAGMNEIYLYKADVPELADNHFSTNEELRSFLEPFDTPMDLYEDLKSSQDGFSFMTSDYVALENSFAGKSLSNGMKFSLGYIGNTTDVFGIVQYVLPGTSAEEKGIKRGDLFTEIDGLQMNENNLSSLLGRDSYTINLGQINDAGYIEMTDQIVSLTSVEYTENPVLISKVLEVEGINVGYIMYNSFTGNFDSELNAAFTDLKAQGVQELVLDLRYNGGGSVESAVDLASMITGQFEGEIFMKEQWNAKYQRAWDPESYINRFNNKIRTGEAISSLGLGKVYVLTSRRSASASELVINGLDPYIDVVQVGTNTTGKFQASVTLYDSSNFGRENANPNHTYAIQPLVLKSVNSAGVSDYIEGLAPDITKKENLRDYGTLGDPSEPLLKAALNDILGISQEQTTATMKRAEENFRTFGESEMFDPTYQKMYIERLPSSLNL